MSNQALTNESREALRKALSSPMGPDDLRKAGVTTGFGLLNYDLQVPAKMLYAMHVPLRARIPRTKGNGDLGTHWRSIVAINTANLEGVTTEGNRGLVTTDNLISRSANYATLGLDSYVTEEARLGAEGFDDALQKASFNLLNSFLIAEEKMLLTGNSSNALGKPTAPSTTLVTTGGSLSAAITVKVAALTAAGYRAATVAGGCPTTVSGNTGGPQSASITYNGGTSKTSNGTTQAIGSGSTNSVVVTCPAVPGAMAYAWFWHGTPGSEALGAITTSNTVTITGAAAGTQLASVFASTDYSGNAAGFDGLSAIIANSYNAFGSSTDPYGAYWKSLDGATLTPTGSGTIVEIENMLVDRWNNYQLGIDTLYVNAQQLMDIRTAVLTGMKNYPLARMDFDPMGSHAVAGGGSCFRYFSPFAKSESGNMIDIVLHPYLPAGSMIGVSWTLPYSVSNVSNPLEVKYQRDVWQTEWPQVRNTYDFSIFSREVLADYAPFSLAMIQNVGAGVTALS
jgi:hypothetical protein